MNDLMGLLLTRCQLDLLSWCGNVRVLNIQWNRLRFVVDRHFLWRCLYEKLVTACGLSSISLLLLTTKKSLNTGEVFWSNHQNGHLLSVVDSLWSKQFLDGHLRIGHRNYIQVSVVGIVVDGIGASWEKGKQREADDGKLEGKKIQIKDAILE